MKHAILITAYKDFEQLEQHLNIIDDFFNVYIHIDKKTKISVGQIERLWAIDVVKYVGQDYKVNWGGVNHLWAYVRLMKMALMDNENIYFHLITGQDVIVKKGDAFRALEKDNKDYISYFKMPDARWKYGGMHRLEHFHFNDIIDHKKFRLFHVLMTRFQAKIKVKRKLPTQFTQLYGGSTYWTLTKKTCEYVFEYLAKDDRLQKRLNMTLCPEEFVFQTIIMNSQYAGNVVNDGLRYIDWTRGRGGLPAFLDETDLPKIKKSNALFARKIDQKRNSLFDMIIG